MGDRRDARRARMRADALVQRVAARVQLPAGLVLCAAMLTACSSNPFTTSPPATAGKTVAPAATASPDVATLGPPPSETAPDVAAPLTIDSSLLGFLPTAVGGTPLTESLDEASDALNDESLQKLAVSLDSAVAADAANGNLVYANVIRLQPDDFGDEAFRQWRDSYDEGACSAAGGVVGNAEAQIAGRTVYITSCATGLHTYHVWLKGQAVLISASSIGDARFGELLMNSLRVPS